MKWVHGNSSQELDEFFATQDLLFEDDCSDEKDLLFEDDCFDEKGMDTVKDSTGGEDAEGHISPNTAVPSKTTKTRVKRPSSSTGKHSTKSRKKSHVMSNLFDGLVFLFVPPAMTSSALGRTKASIFTSHGAKVVNKFDDTVTHVITLKNVSLDSVLEKLGGSVDIPIVKDSWVSECIEDSTILSYTPYQLAFECKTENSTGNSSPPKDDSMPSKQNSESPALQNDVNVPSGSATKTPEPLDHPDDFDQFIEYAKLEREAEEFLSDKEEPEDELETDNPGDKNDDNGDYVHKNDLVVRKNAPPVYNGRRRRRVDVSKFLCAQTTSHKAVEKSPNDRVISLFSLMMSHYEMAGDQWRVQAYRKAITALRNQKTQISLASEAVKICGIGARLAQKLEEIVTTGRLERLNDAQHDEASKVISTLVNIHGVGVKTAQKWYHQGVRSLEDALKRPDLSETQKIGIKKYDDFIQRMPRHVVQEHYEFVKKSLYDIDPAMEIHVMGSFRRGKPTCGDIDILLTKEDAQYEELETALSKLLISLEKRNFVQCTLAGRHSQRGEWMGATSVPGDPTWRRMDILLVPYEEMGAASIYYTGNDLFNRSLRLLANKKGYRLNEHGLFHDALPSRANEKRVDYSPADLVESRDERRIFEVLDVPYCHPTKRNVG